MGLPSLEDYIRILQAVSRSVRKNFLQTYFDATRFGCSPELIRVAWTRCVKHILVLVSTKPSYVG